MSTTQKLLGHSTDGNAAVLERDGQRFATRNHAHALRVCGVLGSLATVLQQNDLSIATLDRVAPALSSVCD